MRCVFFCVAAAAAASVHAPTRVAQAKNVSSSDKTDMKAYVKRFEDTFLKGLHKGIRAKKRDRADRVAAATTAF